MKSEMIRDLFQSQEMARKKYLRPQFLELGLTVGQGQPRILANLKKYGPQTQRKLSDLCHLDVTTMSRTLDRMEAAGLLAREDNPSCRRSYLICLTPLGEEKARRVQEIFLRYEELLRDSLTEEECAALCGALQKITDSLLSEAARQEEQQSSVSSVPSARRQPRP